MGDNEDGVNEPDAGTDKVEYRLGFGGDINPAEANSLRDRICQILERSDFGSLVIMFSSSGGGTYPSLALFNFISHLPVPVHMHAMGHIASAAVPVFLAGSKRTSSPFARFQFHEYGWDIEGRRTIVQINEVVELLRNDIELAREIIKTRTQAPPEILQTLDGRSPPTIVSSEDAMAFGLVEDVRELGEHGDNGMRVAVWTAHA